MMELPKKTPVRSYRTEFKLDETPISEGGMWLNGRQARASTGPTCWSRTVVAFGEVIAQ